MMLKQKFVPMIVGAMGALVSTSSMALDYNPLKFYFGGDGGTSRETPTLKSLKIDNAFTNKERDIYQKSNANNDFFVGLRLSRFGVEAGWLPKEEFRFPVKIIIGGGGPLTITRMNTGTMMRTQLYFEASYYQPIIFGLEASFSFGATRLSHKYNEFLSKLPGIDMTTDTNIGYRGGLGLQYTTKYGLFGRATYRLQQGNAYVKSMNIFRIGIGVIF